MRPTSTEPVLVAKSEIPRGTVIDAEDLTAARINLDPAVAVVPAGRLTAPPEAGHSPVASPQSDVDPRPSCP